MDPSGEQHVPQGTSPKPNLGTVVWRHVSMKRGPGIGRVQNDELSKPDRGTESKVPMPWRRGGKL